MGTDTDDYRFFAALHAALEDEPIEADRETLRFLRSWHQHPALREALTYRGINLGEMLETHLLHRVVPIMARGFGARNNP